MQDHSLILHPDQKARLKNNKPAGTKGSLRQKTQVDSLLAFINRLLLVENPAAKIEPLSETLKEVFQLAPSKKHMNNRNLGRLELACRNSAILLLFDFTGFWILQTGKYTGK